jgi:hypothetical protein
LAGKNSKDIYLLDWCSFSLGKKRIVQAGPCITTFPAINRLRT